MFVLKIDKRAKFDNGEDPLDAEEQAQQGHGHGFNPFGHGFNPFGNGNGNFQFKFNLQSTFFNLYLSVIAKRLWFGEKK